MVFMMQVPPSMVDYPLLNANGRPFRTARLAALQTPCQAIGLATF
jgi:hypothetical protein